MNFVSGKVPGSDVMQERVVSQATSMASQLDLSRAIVAHRRGTRWAGHRRRLHFCFCWRCTSSARLSQHRVLAIIHAVCGSSLAESAWRSIWLGSFPPRLPVGQRLDVRMNLTKGDRESMKAIVYYQYDDGPVMQEFMTRGADGTYAASLDTRVATSGQASHRDESVDARR